MNILRFSAEASLYKTSVQYGYPLSAFAQANTGVISQNLVRFAVHVPDM